MAGRIRSAWARGLGRAAGAASRLRGGGATSLPGLVGLKVQPQLIQHLRQQLEQVVVVTGTNGKTTTARFIGQLWQEPDRTIVDNARGSNLLRGIATSLLQADLRHRPNGLFEVDEATMPAACLQLQPDVVLVTNLFRDQLDRYGELERTAEYLRQGLQALRPETTVILNADDPLVASLGKGLPCRVVYYGIEDTSVARPALPHAADSLADPATGELLEYDAVFVGHLGHYRSPSGPLQRPKPTVTLDSVKLQALDSSELTFGLTTPQPEKLSVTIPLPGLYNAYNALAATAVGTVLAVPLPTIGDALAQTAAAFGRVERVQIEGRELWIGLIKNPTGTNEVIHTLALAAESHHFLVLINDNFADGEDVSWLWDADWEELTARAESVDLAGTRSADMAVRLKYAGFPASTVFEASDLASALDAGLARLQPGETLYVLPTYTALLALRHILTERGHVEHYLG